MGTGVTKTMSLAAPCGSRRWGAMTLRWRCSRKNAGVGVTMHDDMVLARQRRASFSASLWVFFSIVLSSRTLGWVMLLFSGIVVLRRLRSARKGRQDLVQQHLESRREASKVIKSLSFTWITILNEVINTVIQTGIFSNDERVPSLNFLVSSRP